MRFLVDNALSPALAVCSPTLAMTPSTCVRWACSTQDRDIFERAADDDRVLVSADADFGTLLATRSARKPSVMQFRGPGSRKPDVLAHTLLSNLSQLSEALEHGSIVTLEPSRIRVRALPIGGTANESR